MEYLIALAFASLILVAYHYGKNRGSFWMVQRYVKNYFLLHQTGAIDKKTLLLFLPSLKEEEYEIIMRALNANVKI